MSIKKVIPAQFRVLFLATAAAVMAACSGTGGSQSPILPSDTASAPAMSTAASSPTPTPVQWANGSSYAPSSLKVSFAKAPGTGDVLVVAFSNNGQSGGAANTYTPPSGWTAADSNTSHPYATFQLFTHVVAAGETNTYSFKTAAAQREHVWLAADVSNARGIDQHANAYMSATTSFTTPSVTPTQSNDIAIALNMPASQNSATWTNSAGWSLGTGPTSVWNDEGVTQSLSSTSAVSERATLSSPTKGFAAIVLLAAGSGIGSTPAPAPSAAPTAKPTNAPTSTPIITPIVTPTSAPVTSGAYTYHGCKVYAPNDWFTTNLVTGGSSYVPNSVDPNSAAIITNLNSAYPTGAFRYAETEETVNLISNSNPPVAQPVISNLQWGWANDPYNDDPDHTMPIAKTFYQEGRVWNGSTTSPNTCKGDCHVVTLNTDTCVTWETYWSHSVSWDGTTFTADNGFVHNLNHPFNDQYVQDSWHGDTAADLPMFGNEDYGEDASLPAIPHSVAFVLGLPTKAVGGHVAPATGGMTCQTYCNHPLPYGARLRLHASFQCPSKVSYPQANLICIQMKTYGIIFEDTSNIDGYFGIRLGNSADGTNPWNENDYMQLLSSLHLSDFDVMTLGTIQ